MSKGGRPRNHDPIADEISALIRQYKNKPALELLSNGNIEILDGDAQTPIFEAVFYKNNVILSWLLDNEVNSNHQDREGWTSLHTCAQQGHLHIMIVLLEHGASPNLLNWHGNAPLWTACHEACLAESTQENWDIIRLLVKFGADVNRKNNYGRSPLDMAIQRSEKLFKILTEGTPSNKLNQTDS